MKQKLIILFLVHLFLLYQSQTKPPESYSLMRGVNENINLNRGMVDLNIPLFDILEGGFKFSNSINYESRGFVPYLYPSFVGLNWNLNQFGKITRESRKIDLTTTANKSLNPFYGSPTAYPEQAIHSSFQYDDPRSYDRNDCIKTIYANNAKKKDIFDHVGDYYATNQFEGLAGYYGKSHNYQPDKYYFDFMGYKGYFVVDNNMKPIVHCENASLKVDISGVNCYDIFGNIPFSQFVIQDDKGNKYFFGGNTDALDINFSYNRFTYDFFGDPAQPISSLGYYGASANKTNYIDSWLLKKIVLTNGTEINAYYRQNDLTVLNNYRGAYSSWNGTATIPRIQGNHFYLHIFEDVGFPTKQTLLQNNLSIKHSRLIGGNLDGIETQVDTFTKMAVLDSIKINDVTVGYTYHNTQNSLELSNNYLDEILIKRKNKAVKKINLVYEDLGATNKRTFLKQVKHSADESIAFDYYNTDDFPIYKNSSLLTYIGGMWNGNYNILDYPPVSEYKTSYDTGALRKVTYPTKGTTTYSYEVSDYSKIMAADTYNSPLDIINYSSFINSPRLNKKVERSNFNDSLVTKYTYLNDAGTSSGVLESGKLYARSVLSHADIKTMIGPELTNIQGLIKYSLVKVSNEGKGFNKMYFSDYSTNPDTLSVKNGHPTYSEYLSKNNERGRLLKDLVYDNNNNLIKETTFKYRNFLGKLPTISYIENCADCKVSDLNYYVAVKIEPYVTANYNSYAITHSMYVPVVPYLPSSKTTKEYFGNKVVETTSKTGYLDKILKTYTEGSGTSENYLWYPYSKESSLISASGTTIKKFLYPIDLYNENPCTSCSDNHTIVGGQYATYKQLHYRNIFTPVVEITKNNENKFSLQENVLYHTNGLESGPYAVKTMRKSLLNAALDFTNYKIPITKTEDQVVFDIYDNKLNPVQKTNKYGIPTVTIWGYNQSLPIATVEGATYSQVMQAFGLNPNDNSSYLQLNIVKKSDLDVNEGTENTFISELDIFKNKDELKNFRISTYTYNPLVGPTSITSVPGVKDFYRYNSNNRLEKQVDLNNSIVKEYKYNYAPLKYYNAKKSQTFMRNNCGSGATAGVYTYTVPANQYVSLLSQADADQKAQNDINTNGQNMANSNGTCTSISCSVGFNTSIGISGGGGISVQPNSYYKMSFGFSSGPNSINLPWTTGVKIATISGSCKPATEYSSYNGQVYYTIKTNGDVILKAHSGAPRPNNTSYNYEFYFPVN